MTLSDQDTQIKEEMERRLDRAGRYFKQAESEEVHLSHDAYMLMDMMYRDAMWNLRQLRYQAWHGDEVPA